MTGQRPSTAISNERKKIVRFRLAIMKLLAARYYVYRRDQGRGI
jgi:hypothetical protein